MKHTLHLIGHLGHFNAYLDMEPGQTVRRYLREYPDTEGSPLDMMKTLHFDDEFTVYDAEEIPHPLAELMRSEQ